MLNQPQVYSLFRVISRVAAVSLSATLLICGLPTAVFAQEYVPPVEGLPGRRQGGGTRGDCLRGDAPLVALMPDSNFGQTLDSYPTFYWYVPDIAAEAAEFVLLDQQDNEIYVAEFQLANRAGIISISLPEMAGLPPLELGENYHWYFSLICDRLDRSGDLFTEGWVRRIEDPALVQEITGLPERDRATRYAEAGIWHEALDTLAQLRRSQPNMPNAVDGWETLLNSVGLGNYADEPFVELTEESSFVGD
ncbi:MAG TPA: DUF928 domain-containing protein [Elainellaceae cyanobacterium]